MLEAEARIATNQAGRLLTELASAWVHTYRLRYDAITAEVELPGAELVMTADGDSLTLRLVGPEGQAFDAASEAVARHVDRVAARETGIRCMWTRLS